MASGTWRIFVENEAGSAQKNAYDEQTLAWRWAMPLPCAYPYPYGFVLGTRGDDGDAVDAYVLTRRPLAAGSTVDGVVVGLVEQREGDEVDHKVLIALPDEHPTVDDAAVAPIRAFVDAVFAHATPRAVIGRLLSADEAEAHLARSRV